MRGSLTTPGRANVASTALLDVSDVPEAFEAIRRPVAIVESTRGPRAVVLDDAGLLTPDLMRHEVLAVLPP
ncbi:MAG: 2-nitropropane dioxygenase, partial [Actinomycetota bacterium]|nr:2-nitropropane dioxygenase [Actinomycetota bacterium]